MMRATKDELARGATRFTYEFSAAESSDEARAYAAIANQATRAVAEMLNGTGWNSNGQNFLEGQDCAHGMYDISSWLAMFCNVFIHIEYYKDLSPKKLSVMPPYLWRINSDASFLWKKGEPHYIQYDAGNFEIEKPYYTENIVAAHANKDMDQRYGFPFAYNLSVHVDSLRKLVNGLANARVAASPHIYEYLEGKDGRGFNQEEWVKAFNTLPEQLAALGNDFNPLSNAFIKLRNGKGNATMLSPSSGALTNFGDYDIFVQIMAISYGVQAALMHGASKSNRATLEFLMRLLEKVRRRWRQHLENTVIFPVFYRVLYMARIPLNKIVCEIKWEEDSTPEEMLAKATFAKEGWQDTLFAKETAHELGCQFIGVKPSVDRARQESESQKGIKPPEEQRRNVRLSGATSKLPGQDISQQILDALDQNGTKTQ